MLLGRKDERLAIDRLLAEARAGRSGVLAFVGEPGVGKSALLDYAELQAGGLRVLRARGIESEAEIPFAGLAELLRPALSAFDRIPAPQARALAGALALGPATGGDRFAIGAATISLLSASAEEAPLALLVDDAHWLDASSAEALLFAARRFVADPIALVVAAREGVPSFLDGADLRVMRVAGLGQTDAATLLEGADVPAELAERLTTLTGGNPLAMLELASDATRLAGLPAIEPVPVSTSIATAFLHRFGSLPEPTRRMLVVAATSDGGDLVVLARASAELGIGVSDLDPAEEAGLITRADNRVAFRHPLARAAVYAEASAQERREAHAALASALPDNDIDRRAWHLAAASVGPDDRAATALQRAGERARDRSAYAVSAAAFERGAGLATDDEFRGRLLFAAADASWLAGDGPRTIERLEEAREFSADLRLSAQIDHLRGQVAMRRGPVMEGYPLIVGAADAVAGTDPELAVEMLAEAVVGCFYAGDTPAMLSAAGRAVDLVTDQGSRRARFVATIASGMALVADGQGEAGASAIRDAVEILERADELRDDPRLLVFAVVGPLWLREADAGRALVDGAFEYARAQVAMSVLPALLHMLARDQATTDQWPSAEANYDEATRLAGETGQRVELGAALAGLTWLEARQGHESRCRLHAAEATALCAELGIGLYGIWPVQALGDLELGLGHVAEAIDHYEAQVDLLNRTGIADVDLSPAPELVDAYLRVGRREHAVETAEEFAARAEAKGQPWARARAARCQGLLAENGRIQACFEEALRLHDLTPDTFERARTQLAYGARLRRTRRRIDARDQLREALDAFRDLGAEPWARQADAELAASGETARRRDASTLDDLTPQELQISRLLADGKTTREAAAAIFVSPKTVEYHLGHVYAKLGIHSRAELADAFRADKRNRRPSPGR